MRPFVPTIQIFLSINWTAISAKCAIDESDDACRQVSRVDVVAAVTGADSDRSLVCRPLVQLPLMLDGVCPLVEVFVIAFQIQHE